MIALRHPALVALLLVGAACAAPPDPAPTPRPAVAPPPTHGWIELALRDRNVPADPAFQHPPQPPTCQIEVQLDGVSVASRDLLPTGAGAPYAVDASFRVRAGAGWHTAIIYYGRCRTFRGQLNSLEAQIRLAVAPGATTTIHYDGSRLTSTPPQLEPPE